MSELSDYCLTPHVQLLQLYHGENKLHFCWDDDDDGGDDVRSFRFLYLDFIVLCHEK